MKKIGLVFLMLSVSMCFAAEKVTYNEILDYEDWTEIYEDYPVDLVLIDVLRSQIDQPLKIEVYFAFWCSDSVNNVPPFLKILDMIGYENIDVDYFTVDRKKGQQKFYVEDLKVERVPTFIFYTKGEEIGRIIENPIQSLIDDFLNILQ